jgi:hypothetical protein
MSDLHYRSIEAIFDTSQSEILRSTSIEVPFGYIRPERVNKGDSNVSILLGNGDGTFKNQTTYGVGYYPYSMEAGDLNNDDKLDLVVANNLDVNVGILLGNGDGTFQNQQVHPIARGAFL